MFVPTRTRHAFHLGARDTHYRMVKYDDPASLNIRGINFGSNITHAIYHVTDLTDNWVSEDGETFTPADMRTLDVLIRQRGSNQFVYAFVTVPANEAGDLCDVYEFKVGWKAKAPSAVIVETSPLDNDINPDLLLQRIEGLYARPLRYVKNHTPAHEKKRRDIATRRYPDV